MDNVSFGTSLKINGLKKYIKNKDVLADVDKIRKKMKKDKYPNAKLEMTLGADKMDAVYINGEKKFDQLAPILRHNKTNHQKYPDVDRYDTSEKEYKKKYKPEGIILFANSSFATILKGEYKEVIAKIKDKVI